MDRLARTLPTLSESAGGAQLSETERSLTHPALLASQSGNPKLDTISNAIWIPMPDPLLGSILDPNLVATLKFIQNPVLDEVFDPIFEL